jgi:hypothetical protein
LESYVVVVKKKSLSNFVSSFEYLFVIALAQKAQSSHKKHQGTMKTAIKTEKIA